MHKTRWIRAGEWTPGGVVAGWPAVRAHLSRLLGRPIAPSPALGVVVAASLIVAETLVSYPLSRVAPANGLAVIYLLGIVVVSIFWGFWLAAATAAVSALAFDYFYT